METNDEQKLDQLIAKSLKLISVESLSEDFEARLIQKIEALNNKNREVNKPLISILSWVFLSVGFLCLISYLFLSSEGQQSTWKFSDEYQSFFTNYFFKASSTLKFNSTVFYSIICFFVMLAIQLPILKYQFEKKQKY